MFKYLGGLLGYSVFSATYFPISLAPTVWKQLIGEKLELADLETIDAYSFQVLRDLHEYAEVVDSEAEFSENVDQTFTTYLTSGEEVILCPGGDTRKVCKADVNEFIDLVL